MIRRFILFTIGILLLLISLPIATKMIIELVHNQIMDSKYTISDINQGYPATSPTYDFQGNKIEIKETIKEAEPFYIDPWKYKMGIADLSLQVNGKEIDNLEGYPVRIEHEGLNRYFGEIAYLTVTHNKRNETEFYILLKKTKEILKEMPNGDIAGGSLDDDLRYTFYIINEEGNISSESFHYSEKNALQTQLLNAGYMYYHQSGYYTDAWHGLPSLFFPFIYPFFTFIIGIILSSAFFPLRKGR